MKKKPEPPILVNQRAANYKFHHRNLANRTEQLSKSDRERMRDISEKYKSMLNKVVDPSTFDALKSEGQKSNLAKIIAIANEFNSEVQAAAMDKRPEQKDERKPRPNEWLSNAVLDGKRQAFRKEHDAAMARLKAVPINTYTNARTDSGQYFSQIQSRLDALGALMNSATTVDEINALTNEIKKISGTKAIDTALKQDWASSLVSYSVQRAMESTKPNEDPAAVTARIQANLSRFLNKEPFTSLPNLMSFTYAARGLTFNVSRQGENALASITDIETYAVNNYPRIAVYLTEKQEKNA